MDKVYEIRGVFLDNGNPVKKALTKNITEYS